MKKNSFIAKGIKSFVLAIIPPIALLCLFLYFDGKALFEKDREASINAIRNESYEAEIIKLSMLRHELDNLANSNFEYKKFRESGEKRMGDDKDIDIAFYISNDGKVTSFGSNENDEISLWYENTKGGKSLKEAFGDTKFHPVEFKDVPKISVNGEFVFDKFSFGDSAGNPTEKMPVIRLTRPLDINDLSKGIVGIQVAAESLFDVYKTETKDMDVRSFVTYKGVWTNENVADVRLPHIVSNDDEIKNLSGELGAGHGGGKGSSYGTDNIWELRTGEYALPNDISSLLSKENITSPVCLQVDEYAYEISSFGADGYYGVIRYKNPQTFVDMLFSKGEFAFICFISIFMLIGIYAYNYLAFQDAIDNFLAGARKLKEVRTFSVAEVLKDQSRHRHIMEMLIELKHYFIRQYNNLRHENEEMIREINHFESGQLEIEAVSERMEKARLELLERRKVNENLIDNISDIIWCFDERGQIVLSSKNLENLLGYDEGEMYSLNVSDIILNSGKGQNYDDVLSILKKRNFDDIELSLRCKNGGNNVITSTGTIRLFDKVSRKNIDTLKPVKYRNKMPVKPPEYDEQMIILAVSKDITHERQRLISIHHRSKELLFANDINKIMSTDIQDLGETANIMIDRLSGILNVSFLVINTIEDESLKLVAYSGYNYKFLKQKFILDLANTNIGFSVKENRILVIHSVDDLHFYDKYALDVLNVLKTLIYIPIERNDKVIGVLTIATDNEVDDELMKTLKYLAHSTSISIEKANIFEKQRMNYYKTVVALTNAMEQKLHSLRGHAARVSEIAALIAERMLLRHDDIGNIKTAGLLHDIGKIGIEDKYLLSDSSEKARKIMRTHPESGGKMIKPIMLSHDIYEAIVFHHLRYDLKGYPSADKYGIKNQPLMAQIIQIANSFENILSEFSRKEDEDTAYKVDAETMRKNIKSTVECIQKNVGSEFSKEAFGGLSKVIEKDEEKVMKVLGGIDAKK